jgi:predicted esterase
MQEFTLSVQRTARCYALGEASAQTREVWILCHGYGQLARYFLEHFRPLARADRWLVAPEGLSRFYLKGTQGRVGASWMTKEDRLQEIADQVAYLNQLWQSLHDQLNQAQQVRWVLLGFSQGAATIWRWVNEGRIHPDAMVLWSGMVPQEYQRLRHLADIRVASVLGTADPYLDPERKQAFQQVLSEAQLSYQHFEFEGGHEIDPTTLLAVADYCGA